MEDILYALKCVERGRKYYDAKVNNLSKQQAFEAILQGLTEREKEIFSQIGRGLSNAQIAEELDISENTVKKHITSLMSKLEVKRRTEVVVCASKIWRRQNEVYNK